ncbi:MAG: cytochrome c [Candidatus Sulcia muelleri]|nr:cytochrome c [Candidatus Karelsulcia muelleri]
MYKIYIYIIIYMLIIILCNNIFFPRNVYMPDMYYSKAYESYSKYRNIFNGKKINKLKILPYGSRPLIPVLGTVNHNNEKMLPYTLPNNNKGYLLSKKIKISPLKGKRTSILKRGEYLYNINCAICHGYKGDGDGFLVRNEKILGVPSYKDIDICIGSIFHVMKYGKNNMGSYSSNLSLLDRWRIAEYVMNLKKI